MRVHFHVAATLLLMLVASGCESPIPSSIVEPEEIEDRVEPEEPEYPVEPEEPDDFVEKTLEDWFLAVCEPFARCGWWVEDACLSVARIDPYADRTGRLFAALDSGEATSDKRKLAACLDAVAARPCDNVQDYDLSSFHECDDAVEGLVADGGACSTTLACQSGLRCSVGSNACRGQCVALGPNGCTYESDCGNRRVCREGQCVSRTWPRLSEVGQSCKATHACVANAKCFNDVCVDIRGEGESCTPPPACPDSDTRFNCHVRQQAECGAMSDRLACDADTARCVRAPATGPCLSGVLCDPYAAWCDTSETPARCRPLKTVGEACEENVECGSGLVRAVCSEAETEGESLCWERHWPPLCSEE